MQATPGLTGNGINVELPVDFLKFENALAGRFLVRVLARVFNEQQRFGLGHRRIQWQTANKEFRRLRATRRPAISDQRLSA